MNLLGSYFLSSYSEVRVNFGPQVSGLKQQFTFKEADSAATFIREIDAGDFLSIFVAIT